MPRDISSRGFSLLEVMVAVAILGLTLTVILSAQGGLAASNRSAANMGQAVHLGRCKMTEIEEQLLKLGYQEIDQIDTGVPCCQDATPEGYTCDTRIEKVEMPNQTSTSDAGASLFEPNAAGSGVQGLLNPAGGAGLNLDVDAGLQGLGNGVLQQMAPGGGGADGMLSMVLGIIYPTLKPMYEASIRRVTVTVHWKEGPKERELPLVQYLTNPQRGGFAGSALLPDGGVMDFSGSGSSGGSSSGGSSSGGNGGGGRSSSGGAKTP